MKVKILKAHQIIGGRAYNKGDVVEVSFDEETTKRLMKSGHFAPAPGAKAVNEALPIEEEEDDFDDLDDRPAVHPPTRAIPKQPRPRVRKPGVVVDGDGEDDEEKE